MTNDILPLLDAGPIGIFDSGYGGLTVYKEIVAKLPQYDYLYLGDNARTPYGTRSFNTIYEYTWECVQALFRRDCRLVILACNTASTKALRIIQQEQLPHITDLRRVLGVLRPTTELAGTFTSSKRLGVLATPGTVSSQSYVIEINRFFPEIKVYQQSCPMWVPLVENQEQEGLGADFFVKKYLDALLAQDPAIDAIILGCTHYPMLLQKIKNYLPPHTKVISQGALVAQSLHDYLLRHPEIEQLCSKNGSEYFLTTEQPEIFDDKTDFFLGRSVKSSHLHI